jgi:hypothetical protein
MVITMMMPNKPHTRHQPPEVIVRCWNLNQTTLISTLTDFKINLFLPLIPKGNRLIFQLSPFRVRGKKAEKSFKVLICQSRIILLQFLQPVIQNQLRVTKTNPFPEIIYKSLRQRTENPLPLL